VEFEIYTEGLLRIQTIRYVTLVLVLLSFSRERSAPMSKAENTSIVCLTP